MNREDTRPGFSKEGFGYGLGKFGPETLFKQYLKLISGVPETVFRQCLNKFSGPNFPHPYSKPYLKNPVEYLTCPLHGDTLALPSMYQSRLLGVRTDPNVAGPEAVPEVGALPEIQMITTSY